MSNLTGHSLAGFAAGLIGLTVFAASCSKEDAASLQNGAKVTFTGRMEETPSSKIAIDVDKDTKKAKVTFTSGEYIAVLCESGSPTVTIGQDNINPDGSVTFSIDRENDSNPYYFYVADQNTFTLIEKVSPGPCMHASCSAYSNIAAGRIPHLAWGKCSKDERTVTFHNALCLLKFTTDVENLSYVEFKGNNDEKLIGQLRINYETGKVTIYEGRQAAEEIPAALTSVRSNVGGVGKDCYIALAPDLTLSDGFTINAYDTDGNLAFVCRTSSEFKTVAGKLLDLGVLEDHSASAYERWQAGYDLEIAGQKYNKSVYGDATLLKNGEKFKGSGVVFIDGAAELTSLATSVGNCICFSNDTGSLATLTISGNVTAASTKSVIAFKDIDIVTPATDYAFDHSGSVDLFVMDNCKVSLQNGFMELGKNSNISKVVIQDSDFIVSVADGGHSCLFSSGTLNDTFTFGTISVRNNIFWSKTPSKFSILATDGGNYGLRADNLYLENNTFYNVDSGLYDPDCTDLSAMFMLAAVHKVCSFKSNLAYSLNGFDDTVTDSSRKLYLLGCFSTEYANQYDITKLLADTPVWYGYSQNLGGVCIYTDAGGVLHYLQTGMTTLTEDPFISIDRTLGIYQKKSTYTGYGAIR